VAGEAGVRHAISLLSAEVDRDMALLGITHLDQLNRDHLFRLAHPSAEL
jgi:L-lactate dehydrogenase (cytochrome)